MSAHVSSPFFPESVEPVVAPVTTADGDPDVALDTLRVLGDVSEEPRKGYRPGVDVAQATDAESEARHIVVLSPAMKEPRLARFERHGAEQLVVPGPDLVQLNEAKDSLEQVLLDPTNPPSDVIVRWPYVTRSGAIQAGEIGDLSNLRVLSILVHRSDKFGMC